jgi:hypothetical protein
MSLQWVSGILPPCLSLSLSLSLSLFLSFFLPLESSRGDDLAERQWPTSVNPVRKLIIEFIAGNEGERKPLAGRAHCRARASPRLIDQPGYSLNRRIPVGSRQSRDPVREFALRDDLRLTMPAKNCSASRFIPRHVAAINTRRHRLITGGDTRRFKYRLTGQVSKARSARGHLSERFIYPSPNLICMHTRMGFLRKLSRRRLTGAGTLPRARARSFSRGVIFDSCRKFRIIRSER